MTDSPTIPEGCYFDEAKGKHVCDFFGKYLRHSMGRWAGQPFALLGWQRDMLMELFGWRRESGLPRYNRAIVFVAKKNGKSTLAAGLVAYYLLCGGERAEVYGAAYTREQSSIIYREAKAMCHSSPALHRHLRPLESRKRILNESTDSFYQALAGESGPVEGINPVFIVFDELHIQKTRVLWDALRYASDAREDSMLLSISTVGVADQTSIWWEQYQYARGLIDGSISDPACFAFIAQADEACRDDVELAGQEEQWKKANPSYGQTVREDKFRDAYQEAKNDSAKWNSFCRYKLNVPTQQWSKAINMDDWRHCCGQLPELAQEWCFGGLDLGSSDDLTALALWFPRDAKPDYLLMRFWLPEATISKRAGKGHQFYDNWRREGWLTVTPGETVDHEVVIRDIVKLANDYRIEEIAYDPWTASHLVAKLEQEGLVMVKIAQSMASLAGPTKSFLERVICRDFVQESPILTWCASNVAVIDDPAGNVRPAKDKSSDKIDGIVAAIMAHGRASLAPKYDDSGPVFL